MKSFAYLQKTYPTFTQDDQSELESIYNEVHQESKQPISKVRSKARKLLLPESIKWLSIVAVLPITFYIGIIFTQKPILDTQFFLDVMTNIGMFTLIVGGWPTILAMMLTYHVEKEAVRNADFLLQTEEGNRLLILDTFFTKRLGGLSRLAFEKTERKKLMEVGLLEYKAGKERIGENHIDGRGKDINSLIGTTGKFIVLKGDGFTVMTKRILDITYGRNSTIHNQGVLTRICIPNRTLTTEQFVGITRKTKFKMLLLAFLSLTLSLLFFIFGLLLVFKTIIFGLLVSLVSSFYGMMSMRDILKIYKLNESFPASLADDLEELFKNFPGYLSFMVLNDTIYIYSNQKLENVFFKNITQLPEFRQEMLLYISLKEGKNFAEKIIKRVKV